MLDSSSKGQKRFTNSLHEIPANARDGKGIFPYSYATSQDVLEQALASLPDHQTAFYDTLSDCVSVSEAEYVSAQSIWEQCQCRNLKDYMMIYLKIDVHLLADIFETFRQTAISEDQLEPLNFFSIPGLSWCAALKSLSTPLDMLQDLTMYEFFEAGVRGGMTFVNQHHAVKSETSQLLYIDINNLYGWALSQKLPYADFEWVEDRAELARILTELPDETEDYGYTLEVDLEIPDAYHGFLSDLPPAPISQKPPNSSCPKLLLTLDSKKNYIIHSALLKYYVDELHVKVARVHRAIKFSQRQVFANYINSNTEKRAKAKSKFLKDYYKLKNNSLFGKSVENLRKRKAVRICNGPEKFLTYSSSPLFKYAIPISEDLVTNIMIKEHICLNRPVYIGQAVLDLSKLRMYRLQYGDLAKYRKIFDPVGGSIKILAGDTDSFFLEVSNIDLQDQLLPMMFSDGLLDTSNYPHFHDLYSKKYENKVGLFKDESAGKEDYVEWVFLRPKCYSLLSADGTSSHKAKGVKRNTHLTHQQYLEVYKSFDPTTNPHTSTCITVSQRNIVSKQHQLQTICYSKRALSIMDDKRMWVGQNVSVPYGHCEYRV